MPRISDCSLICNKISFEEEGYYLEFCNIQHPEILIETIRLNVVKLSFYREEKWYF